ncbi:MAG TPA: oligopeptide transporter, OPT family [Thermoanaerobaculia bacterium]|nr:oligopeptide transporter, OPT family [Thermoanaerobaculia bacterium]HUM29085.1 oligopeptide transporter, OPT family [Thermoanaerobaculia bacterium]HXK67462.1 oligopeptide transporter, OPT family [Thermoanaerobaculia bacterium]
MSQVKFKPYISPETDMKELTFKALFVGVILAMILGAANAYLGLRAGMTVAATFPAAVIAMAVLRPFKGTILEENIARTTGAVGEALAAGAVFTIPGFIIAGVWKDFDIVMGTVLMLVGGILGVLFVILLRRTFMDDHSLPFPESVACTEIVKAGQAGSTGAGLVFGSMGLAALIEFFKNANGIPFIGERFKSIFTIQGKAFPYQFPSPSPAFLGVGFIIGPRLAAITFSGGVFGWLFLMPLALFVRALFDPAFAAHITSTIGIDGGRAILFNEFGAFYADSIKKVAIGAMIVGAFYTLYNMRKSLITGIRRSISSMGGAAEGHVELRTEKDLNFKGVLLAIAAMVVFMFLLYKVLAGSFSISLITTIVMAIAGFLFAAVAGYLVSIIGSSSNPISGLTLSTLLIAAGLLFALGLRGDGGILAALGVATVVCCVAGVAGDMIQDWKVGHFLGGTPWRMEVGGLIGVVAAAFALIWPIMLLHKFGGGIGSETLPAPQAGLMAEVAKGIVGGQMQWSLILIGMFFSLALILIKSPSPMLIAVGMYLPFETTAAIFVGGVFKYILDAMVAKRTGVKEDAPLTEEQQHKKEASENKGLLVASGLVAGEALIGILLAALVAAKVKIFANPIATVVGEIPEYDKLLSEGYTILAKTPSWFGHYFVGFLVMVALGVFMVGMPLKALKKR